MAIQQSIEADVVILGAGISAAMVAERIAEDTEASIAVIEAGNRIFDFDNRYNTRRRFLDYGENPYQGDHILGQDCENIQSRSMCVGGLAMHWGGTTPRYSPEDFRVRSRFGVGRDWPISYDDLDPFYFEAEERLGVGGEQGPPEYDPRSRPYPLDPLPVSWNLQAAKAWAEKSGIPYWRNPVAKLSRPYRGRNQCVRCDTCSICPTGAKYSPDFTFRRLLDEGRITLHDRTLVRRLLPRDGSDDIEEAVAIHRDRPDQEIRIRARHFVLAAGYAWSSHLLLLSAGGRFPDGIANRSGTVGRFMTGHRWVNAFVSAPMRLYPGVYRSDSLLSKRFQHADADAQPDGKYIRHDLRIWESDFGKRARLRDDDGGLLLGAEVMDDWRARIETGSLRMRGYYDVIPSRESALTLEPSKKNAWGDPLPRIDYADDPVSTELRGYTEAKIEERFREILRAGGGEILNISYASDYDHPGGGCRMGDDPANSVVDAWGRAHDHPNLWVAGAPTIVSSGCNNGTLTFAALSLRTASRLANEV